MIKTDILLLLLLMALVWHFFLYAGNILSNEHIQTYLFLTITLWVKHDYYYSQFTEEETEITTS